VITVLRTWGAAIAAAVGGIFTNIRVSARWVYPYNERISRMAGRTMGGD